MQYGGPPKRGGYHPQDLFPWIHSVFIGRQITKKLCAKSTWDPFSVCYSNSLFITCNFYVVVGGLAGISNIRNRTTDSQIIMCIWSTLCRETKQHSYYSIL